MLDSAKESDTVGDEASFVVAQESAEENPNKKKKKSQKYSHSDPNPFTENTMINPFSDSANPNPFSDSAATAGVGGVVIGGVGGVGGVSSASPSLFGSSAEFKFSLDQSREENLFLSGNGFGGPFKVNKQRKKTRTSSPFGDQDGGDDQDSGGFDQSRKRSKRRLVGGPNRRGQTQKPHLQGQSLFQGGPEGSFGLADEWEEKHESAGVSSSAFKFSDAPVTQLESLQLQCTIFESQVCELQKELSMSIEDHNKTKRFLEQAEDRVKIYRGEKALLEGLEYSALHNLKEDLNGALKSVDEEVEIRLKLKTLCVICKTNSRNIVFLDGCSHFCICSSCCDDHIPHNSVDTATGGRRVDDLTESPSASNPTISPPKVCPICDTPFNNTLRVTLHDRQDENQETNRNRSRRGMGSIAQQGENESSIEGLAGEQQSTVVSARGVIGEKKDKDSEEKT